MIGRGSEDNTSNLPGIQWVYVPVRMSNNFMLLPIRMTVFARRLNPVVSCFYNWNGESLMGGKTHFSPPVQYPE